LLSRDLLLMLISRFLWQFAHQSNNIAVGWLVYDVTKSPWALGFVGLAAFAPKLLLTFVAGFVADRFDRRLVMAACTAMQALASLGLLVVALQPVTPIWAIYALFILNGMARGFSGPAAQVMVANIVSREQFSRAIGLATSTQQVATIVGPAAGGLLSAVGAWAPFAGSTLFFAAATCMLLVIRLRYQAKGKDPVRLADAFAGLHFVWHRPVILGAISLDLFSVLLGGATALLPVIASDVLNVGPFGLGILRSMPAVGALTFGLVLARNTIKRGAGHKLFITVAIFGLATVGLGLSTNMYLSMVFLWLIGASDVVSVVIRQTLVQSDTPDHMRGRVAAVNALFVGAANELGEFESGVTAGMFGLVPAILIGGFGTVAVCIIWSLVFPDLRKRGSLTARTS
jgi:MFS family permease